MRSKNIRFVVILAILSLIGISAAQIYWVKAAFNQEQDHFHRQVNVALNQVAGEFYTYNNMSAPNTNPIRQVLGNYYVVMVNSPIDANLLDGLLKKAFATSNLNTDFEYGIYNCDTECMVYDEYVNAEAILVLNEFNNLPIWDESNYYFGVYFPSKSGFLLNRMKIWMFTTIVLLVVILFFGYAMFIIFKQKRLSEIQKDFISNMTHEFKTPISTIAVAAEVLQQPEILNEPERLLTYATIINKENKRLKGQVERVLQLASLENESLQLKKSSISVHRIIMEVTNHFSAIINTKEIKVELLAENDIIIADEHHFTNVIYNLIDNAIKYSPSKVNIKLRTTTKKDELIIAIEDKGVGLTSEQSKHIFDKFYRVSTGDVHDVKGFGIGLSYVKLIVNESGGSIKVESILGKGSKFIMKFKNES